MLFLLQERRSRLFSKEKQSLIEKSVLKHSLSGAASASSSVPYSSAAGSSSVTNTTLTSTSAQGSAANNSSSLAMMSMAAITANLRGERTQLAAQASISEVFLDFVSKHAELNCVLFF